MWTSVDQRSDCTLIYTVHKSFSPSSVRKEKKIFFFLFEIVFSYHQNCGNLRFADNDWIVLYASFNISSVLSRQQLKIFMYFLGLTSTKLGL